MSRLNALGYYYSPPTGDISAVSYRTVERLALLDPITGTVVFDSDLGSLVFWDGSAWRIVTEYAPELVNLTGQEINQLININNVVIGNSQWASLGAMDQTVSTTTAPRFVGLNLEETGVGTDTILINAPAAIAAPYTLTLPIDDGTPGDMLVTDGSGVLSWTKTLVFDNITIPRGADKPINLKGYKIYECTFTLQGGTAPDPEIDPMVYLQFAAATPWAARFKLVIADWDDDSKVGFLTAELAGGKGPVSLAAQPIVVGNTTTVGHPAAMFSTDIATTDTNILLLKDANKAAGTGLYTCTLYVEVFNGTLEKLIDGNSMADIVVYTY